MTELSQVPLQVAHERPVNPARSWNGCSTARSSDQPIRSWEPAAQRAFRERQRGEPLATIPYRIRYVNYRR
jgi:hypothetical protein